MNHTCVDAQSRKATHCGQTKMKMLILTSELIAAVLVFSFMLKAPQVHAQTSCNYYASPNGTGNGLSPSTPFQISKFWPVATPGKTLCLLDGTYTGGNSLIHVPTSFAGTAQQPITIRALNDGKVLIHGGTTRPVDLQGSYGILEGINASGGDNIAFAMRGRNWMARRVVVWNNEPNDKTLVSMAGDHNTIEDCGLFGQARIILTSGSGTPTPTFNTVRRCWGRWEQRRAGGSPTVVFVMGYNGQSNVTFENNITTRDRVPGTPLSDPEGGYMVFATQNSKVLGSITYVKAGSIYDSAKIFGIYAGHPDFPAAPRTGNNLFQDLVAVAEQGYAGFGGLTAYTLASDSGANNTLNNIVGVSGIKGACPTNAFNGCGSYRHGISIAAAIGAGKSMWNEVPGICKRYVNGTLTNEPLWPWPMNQRIKDALVQSGRAPVDITRTMEELLGSIPQACKTGASSPAAALTPQNLRVIDAK